MNTIKYYKVRKIIFGTIAGISWLTMYIMAKLYEAEYASFKLTAICILIAGIIAVITTIGMWFCKENERCCKEELYEQEENSKTIVQKRNEIIPWYEMTIDR